MRAWKRIVAFLLALTMLLVCTVAVANENDTPPMDVPGTEGEGNNDTPPIDVPGENDGLGPNDTPSMDVPDDDEEPEPPATSGTCGTNLTWAYADGVLTITGAGDIDSYDETNPAPWSPLAADIETVALPDGLLSIGDEAFKDCAALTGITIPNSVTAIGEDAFAGCDALATVTYGGTEATRASIAIENGNGKLTGAAWTYTGGGSVIVIIDPILSGSCGESLTWSYEDGVLTIAGSGVMDSYSADSTAPWSGLAGDIETVVLPNGITSIGSEAFKGCTALTDVAIPNSLYVIEESAFEGCTALTEMTFGTSFQEIFAGAFKGCTALSVVNFNDWLQTIDTEAFAGCTALTAIDVPGCVEVIGESAFSGCSSLATVTFGSMVQRIKAHAFQNCTALSTVNFDIPIDQIGDEAFAGCTSLTSLDLQNASTIGVSAFSGCSELLHVSFSKWIATIKTNAFAGCSKLATVSYNDVESARANIQIQDGNGYLTGATWTYRNGGGGQIIIIIEPIAENACGEDLSWEYEDGVLTISGTGDMDSYDSDNPAPWSQYAADIETVVLPDGLTSIGSEAFKGCTSLTEASIPDSVEAIGEGAFEDCAALVNVSLGASAAVIGEDAFAGCNQLATVDYNNTEDARANIQIQDGNGNLTDAEWSYQGGEPEGNVLTFAAESLPAGNTVEINGIAYPVVNGKVALPDDVNTGIVVEYTFHTGDPNDVHTQYPTSLKVWAIREENGVYTAERIEDLDDILQYSGSSIRITGVKGIRMITSVPTDRKATLTRAGIAGFTLKEYGTIVQWDSELNGAPLTLNTPNVKRAYAYHKDDSGAVTDPVFKTVGNLTQYTNVLVGLTDEKCIPDLALRPYMIIVDEQGIEYVIYGGTIHRSIGYIAYQNRAAFAPGSASYAYIWNIIHVVYGDQYDAEYQG